jgi:hypothetical protein
LETTTIEERLSNGFYARPKDFLFDIKALARDAKNIGDKERTLKANELLSNVEVDVATIAGNTGTINWDQLRERQLQRAKAAAEKERKRKAMQSIVNEVQSDIAPGNDSDPDGPVTAGELIPTHTPSRFRLISPPSNGLAAATSSHQLSNGNSHPSRDSDVQMGGVDDNAQPASQATATMHPPSQWPKAELKSLDQSAQATAGTTQLSQRSIITTVPPGMSPSALVNDASTTKTSDPSERSSGKWSTQATNGFHSENYSPADNSQVPDTQVVGVPVSQATSSDEQWPGSQAHGIARGIIRPGVDSGSPTSSQAQNRSSGASKSQVPSLGNILNDSPIDESSQSIRNSGSTSSQPQPVVHEGQVEHFHTELTDRTSGCTIEQLEQINRELMDEIWRSRHEWNRMKVLSSLAKVFNDTISDIEDIQGFLQLSQSI